MTETKVKYLQFRLLLSDRDAWRILYTKTGHLGAFLGLAENVLRQIYLLKIVYIMQLNFEEKS
jgi:hypothetical protein